MFNRSKTNQERSREIDRKGLTIVSEIKLRMDSHLYRKEGKRERKIGTRSSLSYSLHKISAERHPRSLL